MARLFVFDTLLPVHRDCDSNAVFADGADRFFSRSTDSGVSGSSHRDVRTKSRASRNNVGRAAPTSGDRLAIGFNC